MNDFPALQNDYLPADQQNIDDIDTDINVEPGEWEKCKGKCPVCHKNKMMTAWINEDCHIWECFNCGYQISN
jgi:hypothetical protein